MRSPAGEKASGAPALSARPTVVEMNRSYITWQGRYLFPSLAAIGLLLALGVEGLPRWSARLAPPIVVSLALLNALILALVVAPAHWPAP